ncbi:MAG: hypothetical protein DRP12_03435, partial [Candidatus Aenigmatarchaeota archaeon]
ITPEEFQNIDKDKDDLLEPGEISEYVKKPVPPVPVPEEKLIVKEKRTDKPVNLDPCNGLENEGYCRITGPVNPKKTYIVDPETTSDEKITEVRIQKDDKKETIKNEPGRIESEIWPRGYLNLYDDRVVVNPTRDLSEIDIITQDENGKTHVYRLKWQYKERKKKPKKVKGTDIDVHYSENQNPKEKPKAYATVIIPFEAIDPNLKCKSSDNGGYACWIDENRNNKKDADEQTYDSKIEARLKKLPNGRKGKKIEIKEITPVDTDQDGEYDALQIKTQDLELGKHKRYLEVRNPEHFSHQVRIPGETGRELIRNYAKGYYEENGISSPDTPEEYRQLVEELKKGREEMAKAYREMASGGSMTRIGPHGKEVEISVNSEISKPENFLVKTNNLQKANAEEIGKALLRLYTDLGLHELYGRTPFGRNLSLTTMAITQDIFWNVYEALPGGRIDAKVLDEDWYQTQAKFYHQQKQEQEKTEAQAKNQAEEEKEKGPFGYPGFEDKWMDEEEKAKMGITWLAERAAVATAIGKALAPSAAKAAAKQGLPPSGIVPPGPSPGGVPAGPSGPSPGSVPAP